MTTLKSTIILGGGIHMIAITGGPCSGKTTGLSKLVQSLKDKGYKVLVSPESATKLINGGVLPWELSAPVFQKQILLDTLMQEERFMEAAIAYRDLGHKVVILCDRGLMDGQAYVKSPADFEEIVHELGFTLHDICNLRYHAVMHMRTAALGAEKFYTLENNTARMESPEEARIVDEKTLVAWQRHHHPRVIDNSTDFDGKILRLLAEVSAVLGDPEPIEREEKFLIDWLKDEDIPMTFASSEIAQDYLLPLVNGDQNEGVQVEGGQAEGEQVERRVRARKDASGTLYFYTEKRPVAGCARQGARIEIERMITEREYEELLKQKDPALHTITKKRHCFFYESQFIEVNLFYGLQDCGGPRRYLAFMEIEQSHLQRELILPPFVQVVANVTGDSLYSNWALAGGRS